MGGWYAGQQHSISSGANVCIMLLCRVVLGKVRRETQAGDYHDKVGTPQNHEYDSLFGDREMHRREFILYSENSVFPEFAVMYERDFGCPGTGAEAPREQGAKASV